MAVPQYEELSPKKMYEQIKNYLPEAINYFPEYEDTPQFLPPKRFMWDVFSTLNFELATLFVQHSMKIRNWAEDDKNKVVEIDEEILRDIKNASFFSKKKGTALNMLTIDRANKTIKRKRRRG
mgnify:CR=1 FL=1